MTKEKKKEKSDLEWLLNSLIEKGWKPRWIDQKFEVFIECLPYKKIRVCVKKPDYNYDVYSYRELASVESWLWQFICENEMVNHKNEVYHKCYIWEYGDADDYDTYGKLEYRLIESALCDEGELEEFLLSNIKL